MSRRKEAHRPTAARLRLARGVPTSTAGNVEIILTGDPRFGDRGEYHLRYDDGIGRHRWGTHPAVDAVDTRIRLILERDYGVCVTTATVREVAVCVAQAGDYREREDPWAQPVVAYLETVGIDEVTEWQVATMSRLDLQPGQIGPEVVRRIGQILQSLGWAHRRTESGRAGRRREAGQYWPVWVRPAEMPASEWIGEAERAELAGFVVHE